MSEDGLEALVLTPTESALFDVSSIGISKRNTLDTVFPDNRPVQMGSEVFLTDGQVFDFSDLSVSTECAVPFGGIYGNAVGVNAARSHTYYVSRTTASYIIHVCDRARPLKGLKPRRHP